MRRLAFLLIFAALAGCASFDAPKMLSGAEIVGLAQSGMPAEQIIEQLKVTRTVLPLQASDYVRLHESGVPDAVLDYLQAAQIDDIRWRDRYYASPWTHPLYRTWGPCPYGRPSGFMGPTRGGVWGC